MYTTPTNVINSTPDFLVGVDGGQPVLVPRGIGLAGPTGVQDLNGAETAAVRSLVLAAGNFTVNSRDGLGRATSFTDASGTTYTVTYGNFGPVTVSGGGQTRTYSYNAAGQMTGFAAS